MKATLVILAIVAVSWAAIVGAGFAWERWGAPVAPVVEAEPVAPASTARLDIMPPADHPNFAWMVTNCVAKWAPHCDSVVTGLIGLGELKLCVVWGTGRHCVDVEARL